MLACSSASKKRLLQGSVFALVTFHYSFLRKECRHKLAFPPFLSIKHLCALSRAGVYPFLSVDTAHRVVEVCQKCTSQR